MSRVPLAFVQDEELKTKDALAVQTEDLKSEDAKAVCVSEVDREEKKPGTDSPSPMKKEKERADLPSSVEQVEDVDWRGFESDVELSDETSDVVLRSLTGACMPVACSVKEDGQGDADDMAEGVVSAEVDAE